MAWYYVSDPHVAHHGRRTGQVVSVDGLDSELGRIHNKHRDGPSLFPLDDERIADDSQTDLEYAGRHGSGEGDCEVTAGVEC